MSRRIGWPSALRGWRLWVLIVLLLAIVVRVALPSVLRAVLVSQASQALNARVEVGDVDLVLWRGGVALIDVAIRPPAPAATLAQPGAAQAAEPATPVAAAPAAEAVAGAEPPPNATPTPTPGVSQTGPPPDPAAAPAPAEPALIAWKRFAIELQWLPLFQRTVRLREVVLDTPYVALDRLENGEINLAALIPKSTAEPTPAASPTPEVQGEAGWGFGVDRFVLRSGGLRFRDLMIKRVEPIEIALDSIEVADIAIQPGVYGEPARIRVDLKLEEGAVRVDARFAATKIGVAVDADLSAERLSLHHAHVYIPGVGWSDLHGSLSAALKYQLETGAKNQMAGTVSLADVTVHVPGLEQPALAWKSLEVQVDPVDLVAQRAQVTKVTLVAPSIPVRARGADPLPLLATGEDSAPKAAVDDGGRTPRQAIHEPMDRVEGGALRRRG